MFGAPALRAEQLREEAAHTRPESGKVHKPTVNKSYKRHGEILLPDTSWSIMTIIAHPFRDFNSFLR